MVNFLKKLTGAESDLPPEENEENFDSNLDINFEEIENEEDVVFDLPTDVYQDEKNVLLQFSANCNFLQAQVFNLLSSCILKTLFCKLRLL